MNGPVRLDCYRVFPFFWSPSYFFSLSSPFLLPFFILAVSSLFSLLSFFTLFLSRPILLIFSDISISYLILDSEYFGAFINTLLAVRVPPSDCEVHRRLEGNDSKFRNLHA